MSDNRWYHSRLVRSKAEEALKKGNSEGLFMVRKCSSKGDFVLSVLDNNEVKHYQIRRHRNDAFYSIEDDVIFHGLDSLIEYYRDSSKQNLVKLSNYVEGEEPPKDSVQHGRTNLLHRATKEGNLVIVSELLKCGYRLEARNQIGQTAVHVACTYGRNDILRKLIAKNANVNCHDSFGCTPLHYACRINAISTVQILLEFGNANVQSRNLKNGCVPMHECACHGYTDIIRLLLLYKAPLNPRTNNGLTPLQLAKFYKKSQTCIDFLENYETAPAKSDRSEWFHGTLDRTETAEILKPYLNENGAFLVRYSEKVDHSNVLSLTFDNTIFHFLIHNKDNYYFIDNGPLMNSLEHIVDYYGNLADGLPVTLQTPIKPKPKPPLPL